MMIVRILCINYSNIDSLTSGISLHNALITEPVLPNISNVLILFLRDSSSDLDCVTASRSSYILSLDESDDTGNLLFILLKKLVCTKRKSQ